MADPTEDPHSAGIEEGGGPVKSFLEHLEDLRWLLVKSAVALFVSLVVCLLATDKIVAILKWPLKQSALVRVKGDSTKVFIQFGTNSLASFDAKTNKIGPVELGTNGLAIVHFEPVMIGSNMLLSLRVDTQPPEDAMLATATDLVYLDPAAPFLSSLSLAFYGGILLASPFIFYFLAQFILPALRVKEKKYVLRACAVGVGLFFAGISFCFFFVMARALYFAEVWAQWMGVRVPEWRAETYFSFVTKFMLGMGLGFELPVVMLALVKIGILDYRKLAGMRRYMIVINLVLGALLTTPEVFTQVVMAIILQILFEISVWIAWYWEWRDRKADKTIEV